MFRVGSNINGINRAREVLASGSLAGLIDDPDAEVQAVRALRREVKGLSLIDAVRLIREARKDCPGS